jgi:hypothetical protein
MRINNADLICSHLMMDHMISHIKKDFGCISEIKKRDMVLSRKVASRTLILVHIMQSVRLKKQPLALRIMCQMQSSTKLCS